MNQEAYPDALPAQYRLHWYVLERVLGQGGFGITYLARDTNLDQRVAIKEYLPTDVASAARMPRVRPRTDGTSERYRWGLERFIERGAHAGPLRPPEHRARALGVRGQRHRLHGDALRAGREPRHPARAPRHARPGRAAARAAAGARRPGAGARGRLHPPRHQAREHPHPQRRQPGAARLRLGAPRARPQPVDDLLVAPGYAPLEQYYGESDTQGPWTDIYGLAATAYRAITGAAPPDAVLRARGRLGSTADTLVPASSVGQGRYSASLLAAIDHGLQLAEADRPQSMAEWRRELTSNTASVRPPAAPPPARPVAPTAPAPASAQHARTAATMASVPGPGPRVEPPAAVRSVAMPVLLSAGAMALAGGAWLMWPRQVSPPASPPISPPSAPAPAASQAIDAFASPASGPPVEAAPSAPKPPPPALAPSPDRQRTPGVAIVKPLKVADAASTARPPVSAPISAPASAPAPNPAASVVAASPPVTPAPSASAPAPAPAVDPMAAADDALRRGDNAMAERLARSLAKEGNARAMEMLGLMAEEGRGTARNAQQAYIWYSLALQRGRTSARTSVERVKRLLLPADIAQADRPCKTGLETRARPCTPTHADPDQRCSRALRRSCWRCRRCSWAAPPTARRSPPSGP